MEDVQAAADHRGIAIDFAGIEGLSYPITVPLRDGGKQETVATIAAAAGVLHTDRGTHMSRFIEALHDHAGDLSPTHAIAFLDDLRRRLHTDRARLAVDHELFLTRRAPVSDAPSLMGYPCSFTATADGDRIDLELTSTTWVQTVCPCSKAISDYGAHNQRSKVDITVRPRATDGVFATVWFEDLIDLAEAAGSAPLYALLKRPDERYVTMQAYDNPVFVEDVVRQVASSLDGWSHIDDHSVRVVSDESIHRHNAVAELSGRSAKPRA